MKQPLEDRFWAKVDRSGGPDSCWPWTAHRLRGGYGQFHVPTGHRPSRPTLAHRVAFELTNGPLAPGEVVRHGCDNPPCCNPTHLAKGTDRDNTLDMVARGRQRTATGVDHPLAKLTPDAVREIRQLHASGVSMSALARTYGVHVQRISMVVRRLAWKSVP